MNYNIEFELGVRDATKDIEKHGIEYARYLLDGQDPSDPYIQGYTSVVDGEGA